MLEGVNSHTPKGDLSYKIWNSTFHLLVPPNDLIFRRYSPHRVVSVRTPEQRVKLQLL